MRRVESLIFQIYFSSMTGFSFGSIDRKCVRGGLKDGYGGKSSQPIGFEGIRVGVGAKYRTMNWYLLVSSPKMLYPGRCFL